MFPTKHWCGCAAFWIERWRKLGGFRQVPQGRLQAERQTGSGQFDTQGIGQGTPGYRQDQCRVFLWKTTGEILEKQHSVPGTVNATRAATSASCWRGWRHGGRWSRSRHRGVIGGAVGGALFIQGNQSPRGVSKLENDQRREEKPAGDAIVSGRADLVAKQPVLYCWAGRETDNA